MSTIQFATRDRGHALGFLKRLYPGLAVEDTPESAKAVLDFVAADVIRIGDPAFYSGAIFPSKGTPEEIAAATDALRTFHDVTMRTPSPTTPEDEG